MFSFSSRVIYFSKICLEELQDEAQVFMSQMKEAEEGNSWKLDTLVENPSLPVVENSWSKWANDIKTNVLCQVENQDGNRINGYCCVKVTEYLLARIPLFPVWSTVCQSQFGYNNNCEPASSASVEGEFNKLKNCVFKDRLTAKIRPDEAIEKHCDYLLSRNKVDIARALGGTLNVSTDGQVPESEDDSTKTNNEFDETENDENPSVNENDEYVPAEKNDENPTEPYPTVCPACANGDSPEGAHKCFNCGRAVHALEQCSVPRSRDESSEGYGQSRICLDCFSNSLSESTRVQAGKKFEDWGGEVSKSSQKKRKRGGLYLGGNPKYIRDKLHFDNHRSLPILKNGSDSSIKAVHWRNKEITLWYTCHSDAIFQLILAGSSDYPKVQKYVSICIKNIFCGTKSLIIV